MDSSLGSAEGPDSREPSTGATDGSDAHGEGGHEVVVCDDCGRSVELDFTIPCACGAILCEACFDRIHEEHGDHGDDFIGSY